MAKHPRRLMTFYRPGTGQLSFLVVFTVMSTLMLVGSLLVFSNTSSSGGPAENPEVVFLDSDELETTETPPVEVDATPVDDDSWSELRVASGTIAMIAIANFVLLFGFGIVVSHRIFGPIYRLRVFIDALKRGEYDQRLILRGHVSFQILASGLNELALDLKSKPR